MTPEGRAIAQTLLAGYESWADDRGILSAMEDDPEVASPSASQWEASDTAGVEYAHSLADLLRKVVEDLPDVDQVAIADMDGTLRGLDGRPPGEEITWKELALKLVEKYENKPPTYHGILMAQCLECGYLSTSKTELEYWNDYGVPCIRETDRHEGRTRWWTSDGRVTVTETDDEGTTWREEVKAPKQGEIPD